MFKIFIVNKMVILFVHLQLTLFPNQKKETPYKIQSIGLSPKNLRLLSNSQSSKSCDISYINHRKAFKLLSENECFQFDFYLKM